MVGIAAQETNSTTPTRQHALVARTCGDGHRAGVAW